MNIGVRKFGVAVVMIGLGAICTGALTAQSHVAREDIEWLDVWLPHTNEHDLPRVLLIGDSITRGYGPKVEEELKGIAYVGRMATSKSLGDPALSVQVALVLQEQHFDIVHFNNGLHGRDYSEDEYRAAFPELLATIRRYAPGCRMVWASITDVRVAEHLDQAGAFNGRVLERNKIAAAITAKEGIPVDDLFALVKDHPTWHANDGVHFNSTGIEAQAAQVASILKEEIARMPRR